MSDEINTQQRQEESERLIAENKTLSQVNDDLVKKVEELSKGIDTYKAAVKTNPKVPAETFKVGDEDYKFIAPVFMWKGKRVVAADAINDEKLLTDMVAAKSGVIVKLK